VLSQWGYLVPHIASFLDVSTGNGDYSEYRPPWLSLRFHPLVSFTCLFRVLLLEPPLPFGLGFLPWGCGALFTTSTKSVLTMASHSHSLAVLDVFHAFDGFLRSRPCGFISPHCRVQGFAFRGLFLMRSRLTLRPLVPSRRWPRSSTSSFPLAPTYVAPSSGLYSAHQSVAVAIGFSYRSSSIPSWPCPSPGFRVWCRWSAFTLLSAHDVWEEASLWFLPSPSAFRPTSNLACLSRGCRPARGL